MKSIKLNLLLVMLAVLFFGSAFCVMDQAFAQQEFIRGDADGDCLVGINDMAYLVGYLVSNCPPPPCMDAGDVNDDGTVSLGDATYLVTYLFKGGPEPSLPFPEPGTDPTGDGLDCLAECVLPDPDPVDLLIAGDASVCEETVVVVSITAENSENLYGYQIYLQYDENILEATGVEISGTLVPDVFQYSIDVAGGVEIACIVDCDGVENIPAGTNELVEITFSVDPEAPPGTTLLDLKNVIAVPFRGNLFTYAGGKTYTNLTDGNFTVVPNVSIDTVTDVGNDQGRQVRVNWNRSCYDLVGSPVTITEYSIWRRIGEDKSENPNEEILPSKLGNRIYPPGDWDFITTVPARGEETYYTVCPTLGDSTQAGGMYWSVFFVSAMTSDPLVYFDSELDSGYSLDNIPPLPIQDLEINPNSWFTLLWTVPGEYPEEHPISNYDIRYNTVPVGSDTQAWWSSAVTCPGDSFFYYFVVGGKDSFCVTTNHTSWCHPNVYFAIKGLDDRPNASEISNLYHFICGDVTGDGIGPDLGDVVYLIAYQYRGGPPPKPKVSGDCNCDGVVELGDVVYLIAYQYKGGPPPCSH
jgi:hypothetical protein